MGGPASPADGAAPVRLSAQGSVAFATGSAPLAPDVVQAISGLAEEFAFEFAMYEWRFGAALGLTDRVCLDASVPLRLATTKARYRDSQGRTVSGLPADDLHPEERTEYGLGDASADLRAIVFSSGGAWLTAQAGVTLPLGSTAPDPWLAADSYTGTVRRSFFGRGTFDPQVGVDAGAVLRGVQGTAWGRAGASLYENGLGYRAGDRLSAGLIVDPSRALGLDRLHVQATTAVHHAGRAAWSGRPALNSGRTDLLVGLGAAWRLPGGWSVDLQAQRPVVTAVQGGQVQWPLVLTVGGYFEGGASDAGSAQQEDRSAMETPSAAMSETIQGPPSAAAPRRP